MALRHAPATVARFATLLRGASAIDWIGMARCSALCRRRLSWQHKWRLCIKPSTVAPTLMMWEPPLGWSLAPLGMRNWEPESKRNTVGSLQMYATSTTPSRVRVTGDGPAGCRVRRVLYPLVCSVVLEWCSMVVATGQGRAGMFAAGFAQAQLIHGITQHDEIPQHGYGHHQ